MKILVKDYTIDPPINFPTEYFFFANILPKENDKSISVVLRMPKEENELSHDLVCILERIKK